MMQGFFFANVAASAAAVVVLLLRRFFKDKFFARIFVLLWAAVIIRFLLPFEFSSVLSVYSFEKTQPVQYEQETDFYFEQNAVYIPSETAEKENETELYPSPIETKAKISSAEIIFAVWASGAVFVGGFFGIKHFCSVKKIMAESVLFDDFPNDFVPAKNARFYKSKSLCSPLSFGLLRPKIIIPEETSKEQLPFVLLHENVHAKDRDALLKILSLGAIVLNWFNPFVWIAAKYLDRDVERYCDERVLLLLNGEKASAYANTILDFAEKESLSLSYFSAASLTERIVSIMNSKNKKTRFPAVLCVFAAMILIMTACGTVPRETEEKENPEELAELLESAGWQYSVENTYILELEEDDFYSSFVYKIIDDEGKEHISYSCNFTELPVERIVIKDLGIADYIPAQIQCFKAHNETLSVNNYDKLIECGFKVEYNDGEIVVSAEEPIKAKVPEFSLSLHVNLEETEIISESTEVFYFGMQNRNEEYSKEKHAKEISFIDEPDEEIFRSVEERDEKMREEASDTEISFVWPCEETEIICAFGTREGHSGIDIGRESGSVIYAAADGEVFFADNAFNEYGACLSIDHGENISSFYAHCSEIYVERGDKVKAGDIIAKTGSSGNAAEPHLHFELRKIKTQLDPEDFLPVPLDAPTDMEFIRPVEGGYVCCPLWGYKGHVGTDYMPENGQGSDIYAVADGKVVVSKEKHSGYGNTIVIDHGSGVQTLYAHCHELFASLGEEVKAGDVIASVGSSGNSTGPHLHFELRVNGFFVDPELYIPEA